VLAMSSAVAALPSIQFDTVQFQGGLDQITPTLKLPAGVCREALNWECAVTGGYTRISPYERFDGHAKPSDATYSIVQISSFVNTPTLGQTLTGFTTGTTGTIVALGADYLVVTLIVGAGFSLTEVVKVGGTTIGTAVANTVTISALLNAQYLNVAADVYRTLISAATGSGTIRGIFGMTNSGTHEVFAFRDNAGVTACLLYKASTSGWTVVPYFNEVSFTAGGATVPADGATLTQGANTATIKRVMLESGDWLVSSAAGRFIVTTPAPGNFGAGAATIGGITVTLSGIQTAITMLPGGTYEFDRGNFAGQLASQRIYGCDRVNRCFEFDGVTLAPIKTALTTDAPTHLAVHQNHLFVSYGSSILHSGIGTPYDWSAIAGAAEYAVGDTVNGFKVQPGSQDSPAMFVTSLNSSKMLYGDAKDSDNSFRLVNYNTETGGYPRTLVTIGRTYWLDDRGVLDLMTVQEFGNFAAATYTFAIQPFIQEKRSIVNTACANKDKSQYRLFFSDGSGLYLTFVNGKHIGSMPVKFPNPVSCVWNGELANGNEVTYFGSTNGMVYQLDRGSSFDGDSVESFITLNWEAMKAHRIKKAFKRAGLEVQGNVYAAINFEYTLAYGSTEYAQQPTLTYASNFRGGPSWDSGILWDQFVWDGTTIGPTEIEMSGSAENLQMRLSNNLDYLYPHTVNSITIHYLPRRVLR